MYRSWGRFPSGTQIYSLSYARDKRNITYIFFRCAFYRSSQSFSYGRRSIKTSCMFMLFITNPLFLTYYLKIIPKASVRYTNKQGVSSRVALFIFFLAKLCNTRPPVCMSMNNNGPLCSVYCHLHFLFGFVSHTFSLSLLPPLSFMLGHSLFIFKSIQCMDKIAVPPFFCLPKTTNAVSSCRAKHLLAFFIISTFLEIRTIYYSSS